MCFACSGYSKSAPKYCVAGAEFSSGLSTGYLQGVVGDGIGERVLG